jgi:hypothetical protein
MAYILFYRLFCSSCSFNILSPQDIAVMVPKLALNTNQSKVLFHQTWVTLADIGYPV